MESKEERASLPEITSLHVFHSQDHSEMFTELYREEKRRGRKETEVARRIKRDSKGKRQIQPVISSLCVLHRPEHTKRFPKLGREEKREGGDRGDLVEKKESPKVERTIRPVISLPSKNGY